MQGVSPASKDCVALLSVRFHAYRQPQMVQDHRRLWNGVRQSAQGRAQVAAPSLQPDPRSRNGVRRRRVGTGDRRQARAGAVVERDRTLSMPMHGWRCRSVTFRTRVRERRNSSSLRRTFNGACFDESGSAPPNRMSGTTGSLVVRTRLDQHARTTRALFQPVATDTPISLLQSQCSGPPRTTWNPSGRLQVPQARHEWRGRLRHDARPTSLLSFPRHRRWRARVAHRPP